MLMQNVVLKNGLRILFVDSPFSDIVSTALYLRHGSRNEGEEESGVSHFLEHLVANGERAKSRQPSVAKLMEYGGVCFAYTNKETTSYEGTVLSEYAEVLFNAIRDKVFESQFTSEDLTIEKRIILAEYKRKRSGTDQLMDYLSESIHGSSGYGQWVLGKESFIENTDYDYLRKRYEDIYVSDNACLIVIGQDSNKYFPMLEKIFGNVRTGKPTPVEIPLEESVQLKVLRTKSEQVFVCLGAPAPSLREEISGQFEMSMAAWGSIPNCPLFLRAREERGLVYQIQSFYNGYIQTGHWGIYTAVSKDKYVELMDVLVTELHQLREKPLEVDILRRANSVLKTHLGNKFQQTDFFLKLIGKRAVFRQLVHPNEILREYDFVTPGSALTQFQCYIDPSKISVVVMGDISTEEVYDSVRGLGA